MSRSRSRERYSKGYKTHVSRYNGRCNSRYNRSRYGSRYGNYYDYNFYLTQYHHYEYNENESHSHSHRHYHNHNHSHYHSHYHHHHYHDNNKNNKRKKAKEESKSSGFSVIKNENENESDHQTDLEGTVNLKNVTSIHKGRYDIVKRLGQGTFGLVMECIDNKRRIRVAVKIVRSVERYLDAAEIEVDILNKLDRFDISKNSLIIRLYKSFRCEIASIEHYCLIFEKCGRSLYDYIKKNKYNGFQLEHIAMIGYQLFHSISFCHQNKLTHTDLKLENILFVCDEYVRCKKTELYLPRTSFEIRLIDFGGATFESDHHSSIINTRQYRGPEVILNLKWSYPSDIWSIGCILSELFCGELLFATHSDAEHLQLMQKILNVKQFPLHMINTKNMDMIKQNNSNKYIQKTKKLSQIIYDPKLCDLIQKCLSLDPNQRITAKEAKHHPFFMQFRNKNIEFMRIYDMIRG
eukprot:11463_1